MEKYQVLQEIKEQVLNAYAKSFNGWAFRQADLIRKNIIIDSDNFFKDYSIMTMKARDVRDRLSKVNSRKQIKIKDKKIDFDSIRDLRFILIDVDGNDYSNVADEISYCIESIESLIDDFDSQFGENALDSLTRDVSLKSLQIYFSKEDELVLYQYLRFNNVQYSEKDSFRRKVEKMVNHLCHKYINDNLSLKKMYDLKFSKFTCLKELVDIFGGSGNSILKKK